MMKFETPVIEVSKYEVVDIITTSQDWETDERG